MKRKISLVLGLILCIIANLCAEDSTGGKTAPAKGSLDLAKTISFLTPIIGYGADARFSPIAEETHAVDGYRAKLVYNGCKSEEDASQSLKETVYMNANSVKVYLHAYYATRDGIEYKRTIKAEATEYYLAHILEELGIRGLQSALRALQAHIVYYEQQGKGNLPSLRRIHEKYNALSESI